MAQAEPLFDAGPPTPPPENRQRPGDKVLYKPKAVRGMYTNRAENIRVRAVVQAHLEECVQLGSAHRSLKWLWGHERGKFAKAWVDLAQKLGIRAPGNPRHQKHKTDKSPYDLRVDAARTNVRQFLEGKDMADWALVGMESVVCDRKGLALPGGAYREQGRLVS